MSEREQEDLIPPSSSWPLGQKEPGCSAQLWAQGRMDVVRSHAACIVLQPRCRRTSTRAGCGRRPAPLQSPKLIGTCRKTPTCATSSWPSGPTRPRTATSTTRSRTCARTRATPSTAAARSRSKRRLHATAPTGLGTWPLPQRAARPRPTGLRAHMTVLNGLLLFAPRATLRSAVALRRGPRPSHPITPADRVFGRRLPGHTRVRAHLKERALRSRNTVHAAACAWSSTSRLDTPRAPPSFDPLHQHSSAACAPTPWRLS